MRKLIYIYKKLLFILYNKHKINLFKLLILFSLFSIENKFNSTLLKIFF